MVYVYFFGTVLWEISYQYEKERKKKGTYFLAIVGEIRYKKKREKKAIDTINFIVVKVFDSIDCCNYSRVLNKNN